MADISKIKLPDGITYSIKDGYTRYIGTTAVPSTSQAQAVTGNTSASTSINNKDEVTAITALGTAIAAAQTITVDNDKVTVAKYGNLSVSVL